VFAEGNTAVTE